MRRTKAIPGNLDEATDVIQHHMYFYVRTYFGPRCEEFEAGCACCETWARYDAFLEYVSDIVSGKKPGTERG